MTAKYQLPCSCGRTTTVQASQAGGMVRCACGQELEVPTMRKLGELARSTEAEEELPPLWTVRQGVAFLGLVTMLCGLAFSGYLFANLPAVEPKAAVRAEDIRTDIEKMPIDKTIILWHVLVTDGLREGDTAESMVIKKARADLMNKVYIGLGIATVGLIVAVIAKLAKPAPMKA